MIIGYGIDLVETLRIRQMVERHGRHFLDRVFTAGEQAYCARSRRRYFEHLAGRFAVKEAVLKALGTGWSQGIAWTEIEVVRAATGAPRLRLSGQTARIANQLLIADWQISISHVSTHAIAGAIAWKNETRGEIA